MLALQAYRAQARVQHPDKGGDAELFGRLQRSFEILSDPKKRAVYDMWAKELQFRYVRGVAAKVRPGDERREFVYLVVASVFATVAPASLCSEWPFKTLDGADY